ncbi:MFS transporter [Paenibacillus doosanensis]|uniref:Transporter YycB n=1 Tax=Paenibacillus konkukensis TaxID=2020716 RepID=A0ABY4RZB9_9BACL|nr:MULTISPECIES: MFS transporter [Paenibacillus]MCS7463344.1 MFS transporter [Paenibacillus doosanensis]UQZ87651.1 putative transporter YycB [Paenibacillus konkukensis]
MQFKFGYLLLALFLAALNLRPAISSISPLLETVRGELDMSGSVASLLTSIPVLCMGLFSPMAVKISHRWGMERTITLALLVIGLGTIIRYFAASSLLMVVTSFLAGIGIAVAGPLLSGFIKRHFAERASSMVGIYSSAMVVGAALSAGLSVPLQHWYGSSWQSSLASWAVFALLALPVWIHLAKRAARPAGGTASQGSAAAKLPWGNKRAWLLTLFFGSMAMMFYSLTAWLAPAVESMGYSKTVAGGILTLFTFIQVPVSFVLPILIARFPKRRYWLMGCALLELVGMFLFMLHASPWLVAVLLGIGAGGLFPMALMLPIEETGNAEAASAWSAMNQSGGYIIGAFGPIFVGWAHDKAGSFIPAFGGLSIVIVLMLVMQWRIGNAVRQPKQAAVPRQAAVVVQGERS